MHNEGKGQYVKTKSLPKCNCFLQICQWLMHILTVFYMFKLNIGTKEKIISIVKPVISIYSKIDKTKVLKTDYRLMQVKSIAECSPLEHSALQYF